MRYRASLAVASAAVCLALGANAEPKSGGVRIEGAVSQTVTSGSSSNFASGNGARAHTSIGSIGSGVTVTGDVSITVRTDEVINLADGDERRATTSIGSIHRGAKIRGRREIIVDTGQVFNAPGEDDDGCVVIGSVGDVAGCD